MKTTEYKDSEVGRIPADWEVTSLADIGEVKMCKRVLKEQTTENGEIPFYKISTFGKKADAYIATNLYLNYKEKFSYPKRGDVLLSAAGTIGRTVIFDGAPSYFQDSNIVWLDNDERKVLNSFLYYVYKEIKWVTESGTIPRIYNGTVRSIKFAYPIDKNEQNAIANSLSSIDSLISSLSELIEKKRMIKEGLMQELLTGKKRLKGFNGKWETVKLNEIAEMSSGGTPSSKEVSFYGGDISFLSISDMTSSGKYIFRTEKTITKLGLENSSARVFPPGTLMYAMYASLGKCSITNIEVAISQAILGFKLSPRVDKMFLYYHFCYIEDSVKKIGQTGTQSNLSKQIVENFALELPEIDEQKAIGRVLSDIDLEISTIESMRDKYLLIKQGMMQQLLTGKTRL